MADPAIQKHRDRTVVIYAFVGVLSTCIIILGNSQSITVPDLTPLMSVAFFLVPLAVTLLFTYRIDTRNKLRATLTQATLLTKQLQILLPTTVLDLRADAVRYIWNGSDVVRRLNLYATDAQKLSETQQQTVVETLLGFSGQLATVKTLKESDIPEALHLYLQIMIFVFSAVLYPLYLCSTDLGDWNYFASYVVTITLLESYKISIWPILLSDM